MKKNLLLFAFCFIAGNILAQKTLLIEKVGSSKRYFYHAGDYMKLRVSKQDTLLKGKLWSIRDSAISIAELRPFDVRLGDIGSVYKQFSFPKKFGKYMGIAGISVFAIIAFNHLINNEQVFTADMFIISGSLLGAGLISFSLKEKRCRTDRGWKIKILEIDVN